MDLILLIIRNLTRNMDKSDDICIVQNIIFKILKYSVKFYLYFNAILFYLRMFTVLLYTTKNQFISYF